MNRHEATRRVMMTIATGPDPVKLPYVAPDGSRPLVVATPGEHLSEVLKRVEAVGGSANVALAEVRKFVVFSIEGDSLAASTSSTSSEADGLNADMSMGMFHIRYSRRREATFVIRGSSAVVSVPKAEFAYAAA